MRRSGRVIWAVVAVGVLLGGSGFGLASPAGAAASWNIVASPVIEVAATLNGVACTSATFCMAVGSTAPRQITSRTLIEQWNGARWSRVPSPSPGRSRGAERCRMRERDELHRGGVQSADTPPGPSRVRPGSPLIERWNGRSWSVVPSPYHFPGTSLSGVSCPSATFCIAVGAGVGALIERWNGHTWSVAASQIAPGDSLSAVSCTAPTDCMAVGSNRTVGTLVERWNGTRWSVVATPANRLGGGRCRASRARARPTASRSATGSSAGVATPRGSSLSVGTARVGRSSILPNRGSASVSCTSASTASRSARPSGRPWSCSGTDALVDCREVGSRPRPH